MAIGLAVADGARGVVVHTADGPKTLEVVLAGCARVLVNRHELSPFLDGREGGRGPTAQVHIILVVL